jgi:hypothetical protein
MEMIIDLERIAAAHWRGTEEQWLGGWLLRAAGGFTGRANSALPLGDPGMPLDEGIAAVTRWYRDRGLPPMMAVPTELDPPARAVSPTQALDHQLSERRWLTRPGSAFVMVADLPLGVHLDVPCAGQGALQAPRLPRLAPLPLPRRPGVTARPLIGSDLRHASTHMAQVLRHGRSTRYV